MKGSFSLHAMVLAVVIGLFYQLPHSTPAQAATSASGDLAASDIRVVFDSGKAASINQNAWTNSTSAWDPSPNVTDMLVQLKTALQASPYNYPSTSAAVKEVEYVVHRTNPRYKEEAVLLQTAHSANGVNSTFYAQSLFIRSDRTKDALGNNNWKLEAIGIGAGNANIGTSLYDTVLAGDLAYERKTGRLLWVHGLISKNHNPIFSLWNYDQLPAHTSGFDVLEQPVYGSNPPTGTDVVTWIRLAPHQTTDDILLAWSCDGKELFTAKWNAGTKSFTGIGGVLEDSLSYGYAGSSAYGSVTTYRSFDMAIEASGRAVLAYGDDGNDAGETSYQISTLRYRTYRLGTGQAGEQVDTSWTNEGNLHRILDITTTRTTPHGPSIVTLAAEPGGNRIAAGIYVMDNGNTPRVYGAIWDGNAHPANAWNTDPTNLGTGNSPYCWKTGITTETSGVYMDQSVSTTLADVALIDGHAREEAPLGAFPVAVAWLQSPPGVSPVTTSAILTYAGESSIQATSGVDWALFAPTGAAANKWALQAPIGGNPNEEISTSMQVLPDKWHLMYVATRYTGAVSGTGGSSPQEVVAGELTAGASTPTWGTIPALDSTIAFNTPSENRHRFFPVGFGINLGFPQLNSIMAGAPDPTTQYFGVGASVTAVQPIHILDRAGLITKNAGIALFIPSTMKMEWGVPLCPATRQVKISGSGVVDLSTIPNVPAGTPGVSPVAPSGASLGAATTVPVCAVQDAQNQDGLLRVLRIGVLNDFTPGEELYLGGLDNGTPLSDPTNKSLVVQGGRNLAGPLPFSAISPSANLGLDVTGDVGNGGIDVFDDNSMRIAERLEISNPVGGQVTNAFVGANLPAAPAGTPLLVFNLTARGGDILLRSLKINLTSVTGTFSTNDLSSLSLTNATSVNTPDANDIVFQFAPLTLTKDTATSFTLTAAVSGLASLDGGQFNLTPGLTPNNIVVDAMPAGTNTPSLDGKGLVALTTFTPKLHKVAKYDVVAATPVALLAGDPLTVTWDSATNSNPPTGYDFASASGGPWTPFTGTGTCTTSAAGSCASTAPTAQAMLTGYIKLTGTSQTPNDFLYGYSVTPFKVSEFLTASDPGQPANALNTITAPVAQAPLLSVGLKADGAAVTLKRLKFTVTPSAGLAVSNYRLMKGASVVAGPQASPDFSALSVNLPNDGTTATFQLQADVDGVPAGSNLPPGGTVAVTLPLTNAVIVGQGTVTNDNPLTVKTSPAGLAQVTKTHTVTTYIVTTSASVNVGAPWTITWQSFGAASPTNVKVEYKTHAVGWTDITGACTITAGQCVTTVPDQASTQAQVRVTDKTTAGITGTSATFNIATVLSGLTLDGGGTWVVGRTQQAQWTQTGSSATTSVDLSLNNGTSYTIPIATQSVVGPFPVTKTTTFQPIGSQATATAKVRVQDSDPNHPTTKVESSTFTIDFAFKNIQPSGGSILLTSPPPITWTTLAGLSIASVKIYGVRSDNSIAFTIGPISNSGSRTWTPAAAEDQFHIRICDASAPTVCADGQPFNIVSMSVSTDKPNYTLGDTMHVTWSGADAIANLKVWFKPSDGSPMIDLLSGGTVPGASGQLDWAIPTTLTVPKAGVVRIEDAGNAATFSESASLTLHGALTILSPSAASRWLINTPQTISWNSKGSSTVKIEWATSAAGPFLLATGTPTVAAVPGTNNVTWTPPSAAKSPTAVVRISDANDATVSVVSPAFHVIGQLTVTQPAGGNFDILSTPSLTIQWTTPQGPIPTLRLRVLDSGNNAIFQDPAVPNPPTQYAWSSVTTGQNLTAEICDANDLTVCASSPFFTVSGLKVDAPTVGQTFTLSAGGVTIPIQWRPVGGSGAANLSYQIAGGPLQALSSGVTSTESATNTFNWNVPAAFATLSNQVQVVIKDVGGSPTGTSAAFAIKGAFAFTAPAAGTYSVTDPVTISWNTIGQITAVSLGWSMDGCATQTAIPVGANAPNGSTSIAWTIPLVAVSNNLQFCVADAMAGHAATTAISTPIIVGAKLAFASPAGGELWPSRAQRDITWTTQGSVGQVKLEYSLDNFATASTIVQTGNTGTFTWTIPDLKSLVADPQQTPSVAVKLRISDATPGHPPVPQVSNALNLIYYKVNWNVRSATPPSPLLSALSVDDTSSWTVADFSLNGQTTRYYPFGTFSTIWSVKDVGGVVSQGSDENWVSDHDQTRTVLIELLSAEAVVWKVNAEYQYQTGADPISSADDTVEIDSWLERTGKLVDNSDGLIEYGKVDIFENGTLIRTLPAVTAPGQLPDASGLFKFTWDLKRDDGSLVPNGATYFTKTTIRRNGRDFTSGGALNVTIPKTILSGSGSSGGTGGVTLNELQNELSPLKTDVGAVKGATVGPASTLEQIKTIVAPLPQQLSDAQTAIQANVTSVSNKVDLVKADTASIKTDTTAIKTETDKISTQVIPKIDDVKAYLSDPNAGLPKVLDNQTTMQTQLKAQKKGKILNRATAIEQGDGVTIHYAPADPASVPSIRIYGPSGTLVGPVAMAGPNGDGLFSFAQTFDASLPLGEYTAVVTEPASANSDGTVDNVTVSLRAPTATAQAVSDVTTKLNSLTTQLSTMESNLDAQLAAIQTAMATKAQTDTLTTLVNDLKTKWGTLSAQDLQNALTNLSTQMGGVAKDVDVQALKTTLAAVQSAMAKDSDMQTALSGLTTLQTNLTNLSTQVGTPAQAAALQAVADQVTALKNQIAALPGAVDYSAQLTALQTSLTTLTSTLGTPAQAAALQTATDKVTTLQTNLTTLAGAISDPAQKTALQAVADQVTAVQNQIAALPGAKDYTAQLSAISASLDALKTTTTTVQTAVQQFPTDTARTAQLNDALTKLTAVQDAVKALGGSGSDTSILARLDELQKAVNSAQGSSAAVGLSQSAYTAAKDALTILQQLQAEVQAKGTSPNGALLLGQFGDKIGQANASVTVIPGKMSADEIRDQLKKLAEQAKAVSSDKGFHFDSLYEMTQNQSSDVKTVRNQVEELKTLLEMQRAILEQKVNQPVMKSWFEAN